MSWAVPEFPYEPRDEQELREVEDAYLTPVRQGPLRVVNRPTRWFRGAVHDRDGRLLAMSQKVGGLHGNQAAQADPTRVTPRPEVRRLEGSWLYGGHWIGHFGHFFTESVTTLWPRDLDIRGLVFHRYLGRHHGIQPWQSELVERAGWGGLPVEVVTGTPVQVERLWVPSRSVVANGWAHRGAVDVWDRMVSSVEARPPGPERVFLSRRAFNERRRAEGLSTRTPALRDERLDRAFADAGFAVVAPESLTIAEQIALAAGSRTLAGSAGSSLHLSAFAPAGTQVLELGDTRSPEVQVPMQRVIDVVREHPSAFVPFTTSVSELRTTLRRLGLAG
ncbi:MAG: glycosyltransferase 61 family protein [Nocardioides sp.]|nr:glycosyltransferase 61 family protein [Nocardioides sp.]